MGRGRKQRKLSSTNTGRKNNEKYIGEINKIILSIQQTRTKQENLIRELRQIYIEMNHEAFMKKMVSILMFAVQQPEENYNSNTVLEFLCIFFASYKDCNNNKNPLISAFNFMLTTDGTNPHIRFRLCKLVNIQLGSLGENATLDNSICDQIQKYMLNRLKNQSGNVRAQAINALERLQVPNEPNDLVTKYFIFHLQTDPSSKVRRSVISKIAKNHRTIPFIIERVQDVVEAVRQHTYIEIMKGFPVKSLKIGQRLTILEHGLTDESKSNRKIVSYLMITEWLLSYNDDYLAFLLALKLNGSDNDLQRYHKITKFALREIFKNSKHEKLLTVVTVSKEACSSDSDIDQEGSQSTQFQFCFPMEFITLERSVFWMNLTEYLYEENSSSLDLVLPDLTTYCECLKYYLDFTPASETSFDELQKLERCYILSNLFSNLKYFDYTDEVGKANIKIFICHTLKSSDLLNDQSIQTLLSVLEIIVPDITVRFTMLNKVISDLYEPCAFEFFSDRPTLKEILHCEDNSHDLVTITELKLNVMQMEEQSAKQLNAREFQQARKSIKQLNNFKRDYNQAIKPYVTFLSEDDSTSLTLSMESVSSNVILKCLKIIFYMVSSKNVNALTPAISGIYSNVIGQYTESNEWCLRKWALKCGTAFALLSEQFSQDMFAQLHEQVLNNPCPEVWIVSIRAIFQLLVRYDLEKFRVIDGNNNDENVAGPLADLLSLMLHIMDTCTNTEISNTVVEGFCLLCLNSSASYTDIVSKLLTKYFDPATDSEANQLLGVFFKALVTRNKSIIIKEALIPTIIEVCEADPKSSLGTVHPENIIRFVVKVTNPRNTPDGLNIQASIAQLLLKEIQEHLNTKPQLAKMLSSELLRLQLNQNCSIKYKLSYMIDYILVDYKGGQAIKKNLINYKNSLNENATHETLVESVSIQNDELAESGPLEKSVSDNELIYFTGDDPDVLVNEEQEEESNEMNIISASITNRPTPAWGRNLRRSLIPTAENITPVKVISNPNQSMETCASSPSGSPHCSWNRIRTDTMPNASTRIQPLPYIQVTKLTPNQLNSINFNNLKSNDRKSERVTEKNRPTVEMDEAKTPKCRTKRTDVMSLDRKSRPMTRLAALKNTCQTRSMSNTTTRGLFL